MLSQMDCKPTAQEFERHGASSPISSLSTEILESIFDLIYDSSPFSIISLTLVNRAFYDSARYFRDRKQAFYLKGTDICPISAARLEALLSGSLPSTRTLRHITISSPVIRKDQQTLPNLRDILDLGPQPTNSSSNELKFKPICQLITRTPKLKSFTFEAYMQIPLCIIDALQNHHPNAELHIKNWTRTSQSEGHNDPAEVALSQSPNLRSIEANLGNTEAGFDLRRPAMRRIVALAPNLTTVSITINNTIRSYPPIEPVFEMYSEQSQRSAAFSVANPSSNSIKNLKSQLGEDVNYLEDVTALEILETLEVCQIPFGNFFMNSEQGNRFPSLKHLFINLDKRKGRQYRRVGQNLTKFLMTLQPLSSLQLSCCAHLLPAYTTFLFPHGAHLRTLILHEAETSHGREDKRPIELEQIRRNCPNLVEIGIDINTSIDGMEELHILCQLAKFPFLNAIRLHFGLTRNQFTIKNPLHRGYLENIWGVLRENKTKREAAALLQLIITMGELDRKVPRRISEFWVKWEAENRLHIIATPSDRDDGANEIVVMMKTKDERPVRTRRQIPSGIPNFPQIPGFN
ncbi:hypothetical protein N431DRAFT_528722 [Stipitochalara longipes BDJ]|nr:hypothetical protein N431DRAFT_528722 [Stipitochalara longipes BDJ]